MKPTQEIKDQIAKMAEKEYPILESTSTPLLSRMQMDVLRNQKACERGAMLVMERLDIDEDKLSNILYNVSSGQYDFNKSKQQILNAIKLKI